MEPNIVTMPKEEALKKFESYKDAVRVSRAAADRMMMKAFRALSEGHGVLNLKEAIVKGGVHEDTLLPKLAVMRADLPKVFMRSEGAIVFYSSSGTNYLSRPYKTAQVARKQFHVSGFPHTPPYDQLTQTQKNAIWFSRTFSAAVPPIPPEHRPSDAFSKYCILWEVDEWTPHGPPGDPILLQPIGGDLYAVLAHWDLTEVERMVLGSILGVEP